MIFKSPQHLSPEILQLIRGLLKEDPKQRLGCCGKGYAVIIYSSRLKGPHKPLMAVQDGHFNPKTNNRQKGL